MTANSLPYVQMEPPVFQSVAVAFSPDTGHHWKESGSVCLTPYLQTLVYIGEICPELSLLQAEQSQLSQPFLLGEMCQSLNCPGGLSLDSPLSPSLLCTGTPEVGTLNWSQQIRR